MEDEVEDESIYEVDPDMVKMTEVAEDGEGGLEAEALAEEEKENKSESSENETEEQKVWRAKRAEREEKRLNKQKEAKRETKQVGVDLDYVKLKARRQFLTEKNRQTAKRNNNKDKGTMKGKEDIRDCFLYDDI